MDADELQRIYEVPMDIIRQPSSGRLVAMPR